MIIVVWGVWIGRASEAGRTPHNIQAIGRKNCDLECTKETWSSWSDYSFGMEITDQSCLEGMAEQDSTFTHKNMHVKTK